MLKGCLFLLIIFSSFGFVNGQINNQNYGRNYEDSLQSGSHYRPLRIGVNAGAGFGSLRLGGTNNIQFYNTFLETTGTYALSPRSGLIMGIGYSRFHMNSPAFGAHEPRQQGSVSDQYFVSGGGYFHVNERLTLTGVAQFSVPANGASHLGAYPFGNSRNLDLNAQYKISDKVSIGAGIRYSDRNIGNGFGYPMMNPFMNTYGSPFGSPFMRP